MIRPLTLERAEPCAPLPRPVSIAAVSVRAPWSWALCSGYKPLENRKQAPPLKGEPARWLAVHAGLQTDPHAMRVLEQEIGVEIPMVTSAVVGAILVDGAVTESESPWFMGPVGWTVAACVLLASPILGVKGSLGTFWLPRDVERELAAQWSAAEHRQRREVAP